MALGVFFAILANIGSALANGLTYVYSRICCRCFRIQRVKSEIPSRVMRKKLRRRLVDEEIGEEAFMPTSSIPIPIGKRILRMRPKYIGLVHTHQESLQDWFPKAKTTEPIFFWNFFLWVVYKWPHPLFEIFAPYLLLVTHFTK